MQGDQLPAYTPTAPIIPPTRYSIGQRGGTTPPLISPSQVKGHLAILRSIGKLKDDVQLAEKEKEKEKGWEGVEWDKEKKWGWFVAMAVERFSKWLSGLRVGDERVEMEVWLPPIDVFMVRPPSLFSFQPHFVKIDDEG